MHTACACNGRVCVQACGCPIRCRPLQRRWSCQQLGICVPGAAPRLPPTRGRPGARPDSSRRCAAAAGPRTRAISAPSRAPLTHCGARFVATGTSMRVAECAGGRGPTVRVPGVAAAVLAALAAARRSRESGSTGSSSAWQADVTDARVGGCRRSDWRLGEAPGRLPLAWARPGGHPRPRWRRRLPRKSVPAALVVTGVCVHVLWR